MRRVGLLATLSTWSCSWLLRYAIVTAVSRNTHHRLLLQRLARPKISSLCENRVMMFGLFLGHNGHLTGHSSFIKTNYGKAITKHYCWSFFTIIILEWHHYIRLLLEFSAADWMENYLVNRWRRVLFNGSYSDSVSVECGVPQWSCLGPLACRWHSTCISNNTCWFDCHLEQGARYYRKMDPCKQTDT